MATNLFDLTGKTALITGSSRGLGRAFAEGLASAGASIILNGTSLERLEAAKREMTQSGYHVEIAALMSPMKPRLNQPSTNSIKLVSILTF